MKNITQNDIKYGIEKKIQPSTRSVRPEEFAYLLGISIGTLYQMEKQGKLPPRRQITRRIKRWNLHDVENFLQSKLGFGGAK